MKKKLICSFSLIFSAFIMGYLIWKNKLVLDNFTKGIFVTFLIIFVGSLFTIYPEIINNIKIAYKLVRGKNLVKTQNGFISFGPGTEQIKDSADEPTSNEDFDSEPTLHEINASIIISSLFATSVPTYALNSDYHFIAWNPAFELIFGGLPGVVHGQHVSQWTTYFLNSEEIREHALEFFGDGRKPDVDIEKLNYKSDKFGLFEFTKIATSATDPETGDIVGYNIALNINSVENSKSFYKILYDKLDSHLRWAKYAASYDQILVHFGEYENLLNRHCDAVRRSNRILEFGAGTGNLTERLLQKGKKVYAIDHSNSMLFYLFKKCQEFKDNLFIINSDINYLRRLDENYYDAAVLMNVLMYLENPLATLRMIHSAITSKGVVTLSVPNENSSIEELFVAIRSDLERRNIFDKLRTHYDNAYKINRSMDEGGKLKKYSIVEMEQLLIEAGFSNIFEKSSEIYAGQGIFIAARK